MHDGAVLGAELGGSVDKIEITITGQAHRFAEKREILLEKKTPLWDSSPRMHCLSTIFAIKPNIEPDQFRSINSKHGHSTT